MIGLPHGIGMGRFSSVEEIKLFLIGRGSLVGKGDYGGLSVAAISYGSKKQTTFRAYATHMIHLQIIEALE